MKKFLVATTALVAVASVAQAADPIKINVGGYMNQWVGYTHQDEDGQEDFAEVTQRSETELYFRGSTKLDNGLTVGVNIDRYSDRADSTGDDVFMSISSDSLGTVKLGQTKGAAYGLSHGPSDVGIGNNDGDHDSWIKDNVVDSNQTMTASESNDGQKMVYLTPNFGGFQAGASYGLDTNDSAALSTNSGIVNVGGAGGAQTAVDAGVAYNGDFGGVKVGVDVTGQWNNPTGSTGSTVENRKAYRTGANIEVAGFNLGASYRKTNNEGNAKNIDASGWNVGVSYATGPYAVSVSYQEMDQDNATLTTQEDTAKTWAVGGQYDLGAGVKLAGSVFGAKYDSASATAVNNTTDNEGYGVIAGLKVSF
jgi:outer membrane protein OmpU